MERINRPSTPEEKVEHDLKAAADSVSVIEESIQKLEDGAEASKEIRSNIERNVQHLKLVIGRKHVVDSGADVSSLQAAIELGDAKLSEDIWAN